MRTRDLNAQLRRSLRNSQTRQEKLDIHKLLSRMERSEVELRQLRRLAQCLLGSKEKRATAEGFRAAHAARDEKFSSRIQAMLDAAEARDRQLGAQLCNH